MEMKSQDISETVLCKGGPEIDLFATRVTTQLHFNNIGRI